MNKWIKGLLISVALIVASGTAIGTFFWGMSSGQKKELDASDQPAFVNMERVETQWVGMGVTVWKAEDGSVVLEEVRPEGPAAKAGLRSGDLVLAINAASVKDMPLDEFISMVRGEKPGSQFSLTVIQDAFVGPREVLVRRELIQPYRVESSVLDSEASLLKTGYVDMPDYITEFTPQEIIEVLGKFQEENVEAVVLDLRGTRANLANYDITGGSSEMPVFKILTFFLGSPTRIAYEYEWGTTQRGEVWISKKNLFGGKVIVLVDRSTDFYAGLIANSLQYFNKALVILDEEYGAYDLSYGWERANYYLESHDLPDDVLIFVGKIYGPDHKPYAHGTADAQSYFTATFVPDQLYDVPKVMEFLKQK